MVNKNNINSKGSDNDYKDNNNDSNKKDNNITKRYNNNESLLLYHIVFPIKHNRKKVLTKDIEELIKDVCCIIV